MMSKTHIAIGIGAALILLHPQTISGTITAVVGGTFGGIIPDVDCKATRVNRDVFYGRILATVIILVSVFCGQYLKINLIDIILQTHGNIEIYTGCVLLAVLCMVGRESAHRSFSHSLLYLVLMGISIYLIWPPLLPGFCIGFSSHLLLDSLNRKPVRLLFPLKKGFCLRLCYSDGAANTLLLGVGVGLSVSGIVTAWL